jgi:hypothetical protein
VFFHADAINTAYYHFTGTAADPATASSDDYYGFQNTFWAVILTSLGLGLIWLAIVHIVPRLAPHIAHILAILTLIAVGVLTLVVSSKYLWHNSVTSTTTAPGRLSSLLYAFCWRSSFSACSGSTPTS